MDNTEGSRVIPHVYKVRKNLELRPTPRQLSIILGSILGDAYVYPQGKICFEHGICQSKYLQWKYGELRTLAYKKVARVVRNDKRSNCQTVSNRFFLRQYFRPLRQIFYSQSGKKIIPDLESKWMDALALAVWYMDDGYLDRKTYPLLMTDNYTLKSIKRLQLLFCEQFQLKVLLTTHQRIRIASESKHRFFFL